LIVTSYQTEEEIFQVLEAGALGYILKDLGRDAFIEAIKEVCAGRRWMSSAIKRQFADRGLRQPLTGREMEVLKLLARGLTNREIAHVFDISTSTVKNHVNNLLTKLEVTDRTEAVSSCLSRGLIRPEDL
jgi:two-component system NarL family response regulator